jgi:hypothetical protein
LVCDTYVDTSDKGGMGKVISQVGACKQADCLDIDLECHATAIVVGPSADKADCLTYEKQQVLL